MTWLVGFLPSDFSLCQSSDVGIGVDRDGLGKFE